MIELDVYKIDRNRTVRKFGPPTDFFFCRRYSNKHVFISVTNLSYLQYFQSNASSLHRVFSAQYTFYKRDFIVRRFSAIKTRLRNRRTFRYRFVFICDLWFYVQTDTNIHTRRTFNEKRLWNVYSGCCFFFSARLNDAHRIIYYTRVNLCFYVYQSQVQNFESGVEGGE